ncbi:SUMF1/EgtB/PvdO family nonheme iron enzyme [Microcoleus sp. bin38.metabat.b11b12b14.051]|uniref:SUMF1/EgtB/PvdO family nonheme iron enzyme n=1 Tax=Microcoleus sp. bin38.metabat.b11b12b14.051 TaxID=2742709 RepID=UPI0025DE26E0|nr:SUMF1/EgtB/PvdO family nonheme iron enzyme [Microcoleus sp. bin38.metabat.b11b12b14.051]
MTKSYWNYRICVANYNRVQVQKWNDKYQSLGEPSGIFRYQDKRAEITPMLATARNDELQNSSQTRAIGEVLFEILFDDALLHDFVDFYHRVVQQEKQLLRVELDIDEQGMPEIAALPWEFMCVPTRANLGTIWLGTVSHLAFSRRRSQWIAPPPIQLQKDEKLRIALAISAPEDLSPVAYEPVQEALEKLAIELAERVELLPILKSANPETMNAVLVKKPHILHFIGHGRLVNENNREIGQIAFVDPEFQEARWVDADYFSELFNQHRPGVVMLQACEGGKLSESQAFVGVASRVVQQNISVVVAMQYEVTNSTACRFSRHFYQQLVQGDPVDIAAQYGRRAIALGPMEYRKRDFATPVIFMRVQDGYLFKRDDKSNNSNNLEEFPTQLQVTRQQQKLPIISIPRQGIEGLEEQQNTKLIIPSIPGTQAFKFITVTIDAQGKEINSYLKQTQCLIQDLGNGVMLEMVVIPGGEFLMGSSESKGKRYANERPQHSVTVKPFLMSKTPITQAQWREIACLKYEVNQKLKLRPSNLGGKKHPVTNVSWYDAIEFCDRLSKNTGHEYRLPSEAEWEYACRAGTTTPFHFGETITSNLANYDCGYLYASESKGIYREKTNAVDSFQVANSFGLFDMHGNVLEWCLDLWHESYDGAPTNEDEWLDGSDNQIRVIRGGSWRNEPLLCRSASRWYNNTNKPSQNIGFRIVRSL